MNACFCRKYMTDAVMKASSQPPSVTICRPNSQVPTSLMPNLTIFNFDPTKKCSAIFNPNTFTIFVDKRLHEDCQNMVVGEFCCLS